MVSVDNGIPVKYYRLQWQSGLLMFGISGFLVVVGVLWIYAALTHPNQGPPIWLGGVWLGALLAGSIQWLKMPFRIEVLDDNRVRFISLSGRKELWPRDIVSIKQRAFQSGFIEVKHATGKIRMLHHFTGFHEFLSDLKRVNPAIEVVGC